MPNPPSGALGTEPGKVEYGLLKGMDDPDPNPPLVLGKPGVIAPGFVKAGLTFEPKEFPGKGKEGG
jgi:hypothetical protein